MSQENATAGWTYGSPSPGRRRGSRGSFGQSGALTHLLCTRSQTSLASRYGVAWRGVSHGSAVDDEEMGLNGAVDPNGEGLAGRRLSADSERRLNEILNAPPMRSMRLIGNSNPRYRWARYWKTDDQLHALKAPLRHYYQRTNYLIQQYLYIDRLLDSSLPHDLLNEYNDLPPSSFHGIEVPDTIAEEQSGLAGSIGAGAEDGSSTAVTSRRQSYGALGGGDEVPSGEGDVTPSSAPVKKVKRTPRDIYRAFQTTPLFNNDDDDDDDDGEDLGYGAATNSPKPEIPWLEDDDDVDSGDPIVTLAIYINLVANVALLAGKIGVVATVPSMSVLASLVDAVLDFLSTVIVWLTTWLISKQSKYKYPVGRRRLEPLGVLVFSVIMITSFVQVALESGQRLASSDHEVIQLGIPAIAVMVGTVVIKGLCWLWCRLVKNSGVQALAADAMTDVIFNTGSILFPIVGFYARIWWLDALGGLLLSLVVIYNWSQTSLEHIKNLSGFSATADQRNVLLYLTMRFARGIRQIQGLQAYHVGDKLNVEVDIILDASTPLRDSHDLSESLSYVLESVPIVDRAFVHADYASYNLPTHMEQQSH